MLGSIISAGASLLGGFLGQKSEDKRADQNVALQKEFAQHGVRWKVEDAKAAGLHPLAALGAQTSSFSPIQVGSSLPESFARAGQDISRAVDAKTTHPERIANIQERLLQIQADGAEIDNAIKASQLARMNATQVPPALPSPDSSGLVELEPMRRIASHPAALHSEPTSVSDVGYSRTSSGGLSPTLSKDLSDRQGELEIAGLPWFYRNYIRPNIPWNYFNQDIAPPKNQLPKGAKGWYWSPFEQAWKPHFGWKTFFN